MPRTLEIVALVYRSIAYVDFIVGQLQRFARIDDPAAANNWQVSYRLIANDATPAVLRRLGELRDTQGLRFDVHSNSDLSEFYINRVYRAWNFAMRSSQADIVCPLNSDMALSPGWLDALIRRHDGVNVPCSRLVESGNAMGKNAPVFREGRHVIYGDFGGHPSDFRHDEWLSFAAGLREQHQGQIEPYGFYAPYLIDRERFEAAGGYPHGNIHRRGVGKLTGRGGRASPLLESGDAWFFRVVLGERFGMKHVTVFDSVVWHFKEGEQNDRQ